FPGGVQTLRAPASAECASDTSIHSKDRVSRCAMLPPGPFRIPLFTINRFGVRTGQVAHGVERMDGHIGQENMIHFFSKPPKMRRKEKFDVHGSDFSDYTLIQQPPDLAYGGVKSPVLDDHMNQVILCRQIDQ